MVRSENLVRYLVLLKLFKVEAHALTEILIVV